MCSHLLACACAHSFASLFQHPPNAERTKEENAAFSRSLEVMSDLYASAIGTTTLQLKEIPPRPKEFDGAMCLFGVAAGVDDAAVRAALEPIIEPIGGAIVSGGV